MQYLNCFSKAVDIHGLSRCQVGAICSASVGYLMRFDWFSLGKIWSLRFSVSIQRLILQSNGAWK